MNVYDFDGCIVPYQSWMKCFFYMAHNYQRDKFFTLYRDAFKLAFGGMLRYRIMGYDNFKVNNRLCSVIAQISNQEEFINQFIDILYRDICKSWYFKIKSSEDVWVSCSPEFYLKPLADKLGVKHVIGTRVDLTDGSILGTLKEDNKTFQGIFCHGKEKLRRFKEQYPDAIIENFCTDNIKHDASLIEESKRAFVKTKKLTNPIQIK